MSIDQRVADLPARMDGNMMVGRAGVQLALTPKYNTVLFLTMTAAQTREQTRREEILNAAARVFSREGLAKASMRMIAREASCTTGAIYPLFDGKEAIYAALLERSLKALHAKVAAASAVEPDALNSLEAAAWARAERDRLFAELNVILILANSRRTESIGTTAEALLRSSLQALRERLG